MKRAKIILLLLISVILCLSISGCFVSLSDMSSSTDNGGDIEDSTVTTVADNVDEYEKYSVKVHIDFISNLVFSKYDVDLSINGSHEYTLAHGEDADYEFKWGRGTYTLTFANSGSSSVNGEVNLDVTGDIEAAYQISCYNDHVNVETLYVENKSAVGDNEAMVLASAYDYKYKNYQYIIDSLEGAGFTNISTEVLYEH